MKYLIYKFIYNHISNWVLVFYLMKTMVVNC